ncbi:MAG: hypothetical protein P8P40_09290 [Sulfitobacter sp.]|nr:hypothetical protein [Sulfitobacter sp.]
MEHWKCVLLSAGLYCVAGTAGAAQVLTCSFVTESIETEDCAPTQYDVTVTYKDFAQPQDGMDASANWTDDAVTRSVFLRSRPDITFAMWAENDGRVFGRLVVDATGTVRYVVMDATVPMMITYYGTCKDVA